MDNDCCKNCRHFDSVMIELYTLSISNRYGFYDYCKLHIKDVNINDCACGCYDKGDMWEVGGITNLITKNNE